MSKNHTNHTASPIIAINKDALGIKTKITVTPDSS
jgi:hypothetical protein